MWAWSVTAWAGVTGEIDGQPFEVRSAAAWPGPNPGTVQVTLFDQPVGCEQAVRTDARMLNVHFDAKTGGAARAGWIVTEPAGPVRTEVDGTLDHLPSAPGTTGRLTIDALKGTSVAGSTAFVLCEPIPVLAPPTARFAPSRVELGQRTVEVPVPDWTAAPSVSGHVEYVSPDGHSRFHVGTTCGGACDGQWESKARTHVRRALWGYQGAGWNTAVWKDESPRPGVRVVRYGYGSSAGHLTAVTEVLFWDAAWPRMIVCHGETLEPFPSFLDQAEAACLQLRPLP
jgi:hypothetical protein